VYHPLALYLLPFLRAEYTQANAQARAQADVGFDVLIVAEDGRSFAMNHTFTGPTLKLYSEALAVYHRPDYPSSIRAAARLWSNLHILATNAFPTARISHVNVKRSIELELINSEYLFDGMLATNFITQVLLRSLVHTESGIRRSLRRLHRTIIHDLLQPAS
jgi:hypothetical protein